MKKHYNILSEENMLIITNEKEEVRWKGISDVKWFCVLELLPLQRHLIVHWIRKNYKRLALADQDDVNNY